MSLDNIKNFAKTLLLNPYSSTATEIILSEGEASNFPSAPFNLVWFCSSLYNYPSDDPNVEIIRVTNITGDTLTIQRGQEGTIASDKNINGEFYTLFLGPTKKIFDDIDSTYFKKTGGTISGDTAIQGNISAANLDVVAWNLAADNSHTHSNKSILDNITNAGSGSIITSIERTKLSGIEENANNYTHPATHPATIIVEDSTHRFTTDAEKVSWNNKLDASIYTAADILTKILTVDGPTSGLNADLLDGNHASAFAPSSHTHTKSQITDFPETWAWADITGVPTTFVPSAHTHTVSEITDFPTTWAWTDIADKPATFTPSSHTHTISNITDFPTTWAWSDLTSIPSTFTPSAHTHTLSQITDAGTAAGYNVGTISGTIPVLDSNGKLSTAVMPPLSLVDVTPVASEAAQLALIAQQGDIAIRTDINRTFIHNGGTAGTMDDWSEILTPTDAVSSVNGKTGAVVLTTSDIGEGSNLYFTNGRATSAVGGSKNDSGSGTSDFWSASKIVSELGTKANSSHTHTVSNITDFPSTWAWTDITGKPSTFTPSAHTLDSHSNVTITSNTSGEILKWNGAAWVNNTLAEAGISAVGHTHTVSSITDFPSTWAWGNLTGVPSTFTPSEHTHTFASLTSKPTTLAGYGITDAATSTHNHTLDGLSNTTITSNSNGEILRWNGTAWVNNTLAEAGIQPAGSYAAASHTHTVSQITDFPTTWAWASLTGVPSTFTPSAHYHDDRYIRKDATTTVAAHTTWSQNYEVSLGNVKLWNASADNEFYLRHTSNGQNINLQATSTGGTLNTFVLINPTSDVTLLRNPQNQSGQNLATEAYVTSRGYVTSSGVTSVTVQGTNGLTGSGTVSTTGTISISHADTSSQASVDNSNATVIQDITLDTYGHITSLGSIDLDARFPGLSHIETISGTWTFSNAITVGGIITSGNVDGVDISAFKSAYDSHTHTFASLTSKPTTLAGYGITDAATSTHNHNSTYLGISANAVSASKWATARTITLGGDLTGNVSIDGSANVTLTATVVNDSHEHDGRYYTKTELTNRTLSLKLNAPEVKELIITDSSGVAKYKIVYNATSDSLDTIKL